MTEERRASPRQTAYIAAEIETSAGKASIAITRDVSARGLLVFSRRELAVGEAVKIRLVRGDEEHLVSAKVIRQEVLSPGESTLWRTKVGIRVDDADVLAKLLATIEQEPKADAT
jgi:PilZ domain